VKFTAHGFVKLRADLHSNTLRFEVADSGIGIASDAIPNLFQAYKQAAADTTRKYGGTGLGLSICKQLVEMQGGEIRVDSVVGKGTVFTVQLPYREAGLQADVPASESAISFDAFNQLHLLLVEDNVFNQMLAVDLLQSKAPDMHIDIAGNGLEALAKVQEADYDLVLMDVHMPLMDGYEATRKIRELHGSRASIPVLAMTAAATREEIEECLRAGMNDYIPKPFAPEMLFRKIATLAATRSV
jgi:CheY-like chemotaxis protein